jgi:hypothetical protein
VLKTIQKYKEKSFYYNLFGSKNEAKKIN